MVVFALCTNRKRYRYSCELPWSCVRSEISISYILFIYLFTRNSDFWSCFDQASRWINVFGWVNRVKSMYHLSFIQKRHIERTRMKCSFQLFLLKLSNWFRRNQLCVSALAATYGIDRGVCHFCNQYFRCKWVSSFVWCNFLWESDANIHVQNYSND